MQKRVPGGGPMPRTLYDLLNALFLRCKKKHFWAKVHWRSVHARVQKRFRKKCQKTRSGVPPEQGTPGQDLKLRKCVKCKSKRTPRQFAKKVATRKGHWEAGAHVAPTSVFFEKTHFLKKRVFFNYTWYLDAGTQHWSVPEEAGLAVSRVSFTFSPNFLQNARGLTARRDFRLATGNTLTWRIQRG